MYYLRFAVASEDGYSLYSGHFGDSNYYLIYDINGERFEFIEQIKNRSKEYKERKHGDEKKAVKVSELLSECEGLCGKAFGPNIKRIVKKFVPVVVKVDVVEDAIKILQENYEKILEEYKKGEKRKHLVFR